MPAPSFTVNVTIAFVPKQVDGMVDTIQLIRLDQVCETSLTRGKKFQKKFTTTRDGPVKVQQQERDENTRPPCYKKFVVKHGEYPYTTCIAFKNYVHVCKYAQWHVGKRLMCAWSH